MIQLRVPRNTARDRRAKNGWDEAPGYFDTHVWPNHMAYMKLLSQALPAGRLQVVNGQRPRKQVLRAVRNVVNHCVPRLLHDPAPRSTTKPRNPSPIGTAAGSAGECSRGPTAKAAGRDGSGAGATSYVASGVVGKSDAGVHRHYKKPPPSDAATSPAGATAKEERETPGRCAYVTLLTDDSFFPGVQVLAFSLHEAGARHGLHCMVTPTVSKFVVRRLKQLQVSVIPVSSGASGTCSPPVFSPFFLLLFLAGRFPSLRLCLGTQVAPIPNPHAKVAHVEGWVNSGFTKLHVWNLTHFDKVVYLDADCLVLANIDEVCSEWPCNVWRWLLAHTTSATCSWMLTSPPTTPCPQLFLRPTSFAAAPDVFPPDRFNAGVLVVKPNAALFTRLCTQATVLPSYDTGDTGACYGWRA